MVVFSRAGEEMPDNCKNRQKDKPHNASNAALQIKQGERSSL
jgi:hypothetical protein